MEDPVESKDDGGDQRREGPGDWAQGAMDVVERFTNSNKLETAESVWVRRMKVEGTSRRRL